jgi:tetratricopeptide (TPR) repeat protein
MRGSARTRTIAALIVPITLLATAVAAPVEDPRVQSLAAQAGKAFSSGNLPLAEQLYGEALDLSPSSPRLLVNLAAVKTRRGKTAESTDLARKALSNDWQNSQAWLLLGMNSLEMGKDDEALADLMQATLRDEGNPRAHNYLGIAAGRKGWGEVSEKELRRAVELDPAYADANFNLAVFYLGRTPPLIEMVRRHYQRALDLGAPRDAALEARLAKAVASPAPSPSSSAALP